MTEQDLEYIKNTIDYMLNNSRHKNHEHVYNNASNSINKLEKAIEFIRCCESDSEQLHTEVFNLANKLAINGYGNEALRMHLICNGM